MRPNTDIDFWNRVDKSGPCWIWNGRRNSRDYGEFDLNGETYLAHRLSWFLVKGEWPKDTLDHLCRVHECVNPDHLEDVTAIENVLRGSGSPAVNARKTHCKNGHPLEGRNLLLIPSGRACRKCSNELWARSSRERRRARREGGSCARCHSPLLNRVTAKQKYCSYTCRIAAWEQKRKQGSGIEYSQG